MDIALYGYAVAAALLWLVVQRLTDRAWPVTLLAFGPRWMVLLPVVPLAVVILATNRRWQRIWRLAVVALVAAGLTVGVLDYRFGVGRAAGPSTLRLLTQNLGASHVTAAALDQLLRHEQVDVAALQECPFYDAAPLRFGWYFYYGGDLCLVSRVPFSVLDIADPDNFWRRYDREPIRFEVHAPVPFQLLNLHFETIRGGLYALEDGRAGLTRFRENRNVAWRDSVAARDLARRGSEPLLVAGDFNLPVESAIYQSIWGDMTNAFSVCGRGFGHTKFTRLFGIRIDHVLVSPQWACTDARVLESPYGGDHAPLVVDLRLAPAS